MLNKPVAELSAAAKLAEGQAGAARADVAALREEIQQQATHLTAAADQAARQLASLGKEIDAKAEALVNATDYALNNAGNIGGKFEEQAGKLGNTVAPGAEPGRGRWASRCRSRARRWPRRPAAAQQQVASLGNVQQQAKSEGFLRAAADLVTELNSLALDMNSLLDADVPDEVWRRYKDGDRSAFARRLLRLKDSYVVPALEQRYAKDIKFRDLVMRFTGKFEDLLAQAGKADTDNVLSTAFLTADIGKLYLVIQRNLGKATAHAQLRGASGVPQSSSGLRNQTPGRSSSACSRTLGAGEVSIPTSPRPSRWSRDGRFEHRRISHPSARPALDP